MGFEWINFLRGLGGLAFLLFLCYLMSSDRKAIDWRLVGLALAVQIGFGIGVLSEGRYNFFREALEIVSQSFVKLLSLSRAGTVFIFGELANAGNNWGYIFAIQVLPTIIFFSTVSAILYYLGILQKIVYLFAWALSKLRITGPESVSTSANIFLGQTEAPLMIRPFLEKLNRSEMLCIMVGGMANTAGSVLGAYIGLLSGNDTGEQNYFALHLLSQSIMSAPAAILCSKILMPQPKDYPIDTKVVVPRQKIGDNFLDATTRGVTEGVRLAVNVGAMLLAFTALLKVLNYILFRTGGWMGINDDIVALQPALYASSAIPEDEKGLTLQFLLGYIFAPIAWAIGIDRADMVIAGQLLGVKTILNEFVAYQQFGQLKEAGLLNARSILMCAYALSGFANFASIGIQIGGISLLAPNQRLTITQLGIKSLIGGTIACLMCATVAGMLS